MKRQNIFVILFCLLLTSFVPNKQISNLNINPDCKEIIDSAKAFVQTSEFAINTRPLINDPERNLRLDKWLEKLSFRDFTCLLNSENVSLIAMGFTYAAHHYGDSLVKYYSHLLTDARTVRLFMVNGNKGPEMKLGNVLSMLAEDIKEDNDNFAKSPELEQIVSGFIRQYATYPDSYKPISFPYFSMGSDKNGLTGYNIRHDYEIKNNLGKAEKTVTAFVFDKNLRITVIEKDSSSYISSYPPKLEYWLTDFGRKLTANDSLALRLQ